MVHDVRVNLLDFKQTKGLVLRDNLARLIAVQVDGKPVRAETKLFGDLSGTKADVCLFKTGNDHALQKQDNLNKSNHTALSGLSNAERQISTSQTRRSEIVRKKEQGKRTERKKSCSSLAIIPALQLGHTLATGITIDIAK